MPGVVEELAVLLPLLLLLLLLLLRMQMLGDVKKSDDAQHLNVTDVRENFAETSEVR